LLKLLQAFEALQAPRGVPVITSCGVFASVIIWVYEGE
jgi:hypothetical protein